MRRPSALAAALVLAASVTVGVALTASPHRASADSAATPVLERKLLGFSVQGRAIFAYHLGKRYIHPIDLIVGQMHGDEKAGVTLARSIVDAQRSIEDINLWIIPTMNPDGYVANTRQNAHGVDLNRNWPDNWAQLDPPYYSGTKPLSEPETRAVSKFLWWLKPDYLVVLHQPLYGVDTTDGAYLDPGFRDALARNLGLPKKAFLCGGVCHGSMTGWYTTHHFGVDETIEFGSSPTYDYLVGRARDGIISAMHGRWGSLAAHDPKHYLVLTPRSGGVDAYGWVFDPDTTSTSLRYDIYLDGTDIAHHVTARDSPNVNAKYHITGTHRYEFSVRADPGKHQVCLVYRNLQAGTGDPTVCQDVTVPA